MLSHASCSFKQQQAKVVTAPTEEGGNDSPPPTIIGSTSATSDVSILKVEPGQTISSAPGPAHSTAPAIPISVEAISTAPTGNPVTSTAISITEAASKKDLGGRLGRQKKTFVKQLKHSLGSMHDLCEELEITEDSEQWPELFEETLEGVRREMRVLEEMLKSLVRE